VQELPQERLTTAQRLLLRPRDRAKLTPAIVGRSVIGVAASALGVGLLVAGYWIGAVFLLGGVLNAGVSRRQSSSAVPVPPDRAEPMPKDGLSGSDVSR
jgi:hypothetical protein